MSLIQKAFSDIITFSRSSNATRTGPTGLVEYAPHNLLLRSEEFDNASWSKSGSSVTANAGAAPNGTVTADLIVGASGGQRIDQTVAVTGQFCTFSAYVKAPPSGAFSGATLLLFNVTASGVIAQVRFTGATFSVNVISGTGTVTDVGNGWYRITTSNTVAFTSGNNIAAYLYSDNTGGGGSPNSLLAWGAQLSVGPYALDYTPTTSAAVYGPRFDYDPVTLAARGLLIEEQRTNIYTYSEDFSNAAWSKTGTTVVANATTAPDGQVTADEITFGTGTSALVQTKSGLSAGARYEPSIYIKRITTSGEVILRNTEDGSYGRWSINLALLGSGWERITRNHAAVTITAEFVASPSGVCAPAFYGSDSNIKANLWGAQLEAGSFATSYIPTVASSVTRSADVASVNTLSPWFNATEGTLFIDSSSSALAYSAALYTGLSSYIATLNGPSGSALEVVASSPQAAIGTQGLSTKVAGAYKANDFAVSTNGGTVATDTSGTVPNITDRLQIGSFPAAGFYVNGYIRRIAYYPRRLTNAELVALTA